MELPCLVPRSNILGTLLLLCFVLGLEASHRVYPQWQSMEAVQADPLHRTGYHFQPQKNWINGPMYFKGLYHLFYQYNPNGSVWGNIVWAHSVSKDLINWLPLQPALYPSKPFDINGCWSGSATVLPGDRPVILYTGIDPDNRQVQNYALPKDPSDPYLREWVKPDDNPIVDPSDGHVNESAFRDPTTAWWDRGHWKVAVGGRRKERGMAYLYRSRNFKKWVKAKHPLHSAPRTGMWECPDFYPVSTDGRNGLGASVLAGNLKHVLKVSLDLTRYEYYTLGTYDRKLDRYTPDNTSVDGWKGLRYDYGNFYASKTFFDTSKKRRVLWGWANESDTRQDDVNKGWAGIQLIPRTVVLDESEKQLVQWPIEEVESLRGHITKMRDRVLNSGDKIEIKGITPAQADVEVTFKFGGLEDAKSIEPFDPSWADLDALDVCRQMGSTVKGGVGPFGLLTLASADLEEYTPVFFRIFKDGANYRVLMCSDARRSSLSPERPEMYRPPFGGFVDNVELDCGRLSLRTLIDHSVVESFGAGGRTCITSRVYPMKAIGEKAHLFLFNNGTVPIKVQRMSAWSMNKPKQMN